MLQVILIGNLGSDAETKSANGREFTTFRVAHNDSWTDQNGVKHESAIWVDCILNERPKVADYLKRGQMVAVMGNASLRTYSSEKDRCIKAGLTVNVRTIELLGGSGDLVPSSLADVNGILHRVSKHYWTDMPNITLFSQRGAQFVTDANGFVTPLQQTPVAEQAETTPEDNSSKKGRKAAKNGKNV